MDGWMNNETSEGIEEKELREVKDRTNQSAINLRPQTNCTFTCMSSFSNKVHGVTRRLFTFFSQRCIPIHAWENHLQ